MFILDSLLINGIKFALDKVLQVAEQEMDNPETLQQQLLEAQMQLEEGDDRRRDLCRDRT